MKIIQIETDTYPEISFNDICVCNEDKTEAVGISLSILTSVTKDKLWEIMKIIENSWKLSGDDMPIRITVETVEKQQKNI